MSNTASRPVFSNTSMQFSPTGQVHNALCCLHLLEGSKQYAQTGGRDIVTLGKIQRQCLYATQLSIYEEAAKAVIEVTLTSSSEMSKRIPLSLVMILISSGRRKTVNSLRTGFFYFFPNERIQLFNQQFDLSHGSPVNIIFQQQGLHFLLQGDEIYVKYFLSIISYILSHMPALANTKI